MGAELSAEDFEDISRSATESYASPGWEDRPLQSQEGDDERDSSQRVRMAASRSGRMLRSVGSETPASQDPDTVLRERRRKRRENYRRDKSEEEQRVKAAKEKKKKGWCCAKEEESDDTPTDPGSDFSDRNYYRSRRTGSLRRRHRRDGVTDPYYEQQPSSPMYNYFAVPHTAFRKILLLVEARERNAICDGEDGSREALELASSTILAKLRVILSREANGTQSRADMRTEKEAMAKAQTLVEMEPALAEAFNLLFHNPTLPAKSKGALVTSVSRLLEPSSKGQNLRFDMAGIQLGDDGGLLATRVLRAQPLLSAIVLASTSLTDFGLDVITVTIDALDPQNLDEIDLSGNRISYKGAFRFVSKLAEMYTQARPAKRFLMVNLDGNDSLWLTSRQNAKALVERVTALSQANVAVQLPEPPQGD
jgi:hypothetical protein